MHGLKPFVMRVAARVAIWSTVTFASFFALGLHVIGAWPREKPRDFDGFYASARAVVEGLGPENIYTMIGVANWRFGDSTGYIPLTNPPSSLLFLGALGHFSHPDAFRLLYGLTIVLYVGVCLLLALPYREHFTGWQFAWLVVFVGFWDTLNMNQLYMPLVMATTLAWLLLRSNHQVLGGLLIGVLLAVKPNFAVWPALLLLSGWIPAAVSAFGLAAALWALPLFVYGPSIYSFWLSVVRLELWTFFPNNMSLFGIAARLGLPSFGPILAGALLIFLAIFVWTRRPSLLEASALGLIGSLLASPLAWETYTLFLLPVFLSRQWSKPLKCAAVMLSVPVSVIWEPSQGSPIALFVYGLIYSGAVLLVLVSLLREGIAAQMAALRGSPIPVQVETS